MSNRLIYLPWLALVVGLVAVTPSSPLDAQKGGKRTSKPATGLFRCPGPECPVSDPAAVPAVLADAITGDHFAVPFSSADGAAIDTVGEFALRLVPNGRFLFLDFSNGSPSCGAACRRNFPSIAIDASNLAFLHTNVIDPATGGEADNGVLSIPVGSTWRSRLKIAFNTVGPNGEGIAWAVRFNPRDYYPSDHLSVTRTSSTTWEIFANETERAMLVSTCCRQRGTTNEGLYVMPFRLKVSME